MIILVAGFSEDSGKTILAASLVSTLRSEGLDAVGVKPLAGVDLWRNPGVLRESRLRKLVLSGDGLLLDRAGDGSLGAEAVSPVVVHFAPRDARRGRIVQEPVLGRVSACREGRVDTLHWLNVEALDRVPVGLQAQILDTAGSLEPKPLRAGDEFAQRVLEGAFLAQADSCLHRAVEGHDVVVVESNSDQAAPTPLSLRASLVLVAAYGVAFIVDGDRWAKAVALLAGTRGHIAVSAEEALRVAGHVREVALPFLADPIEGYSRSDLDPILDLVLHR